jgi:hypothetical protein
MITEDYVSFEVAKLLKEKGFDEATHWFYKTITYLGTDANNVCIKPLNGIEDEPFHNSVFGFDLNGEDTGEYAMPTLQMVTKWLREVYKLCVVVKPYITEEGIFYLFEIKEMNKDSVVNKKTKTGFDTYEKACEAAIKYCLENLI